MVNCCAQGDAVYFRNCRSRQGCGDAARDSGGAKTYCGIQHTGASMSRLRTQAVQVPSYVEMEARTARSLSSARHVIQLRANHVEPGEFAYCSLQSCCLNRNCMLLT
ncbi:hypothetical protein, variant, partial [Phytophthora nicotianae]